MANATVIDQLIVALKLDPKEFTKGEKEVAASVLRTKENVKQGARSMSQEMGQAAEGFAKSGGVISRVFSKGGAIGLAIAAIITGGKLANDTLYQIAVNTRRLGLDSRNYNLAANGLRNLQNASEQAGGSLEDATVSAGGLAKSLFDLRFNGQISESLVFLGRLGVKFQDATGKARDFKAVTLDTAEALGKLQAEGRMTQSEAFFAAQQAGFTGGMAQLVTQGRAAVEAELAKQEGRRQVGAGDVGAATARVQAWTSVEQAALAQIGVPAMAETSGANVKASQATEYAINNGQRVIGDLADRAAEGLGNVAEAAKDAARGLASMFGSAANLRGAIYKPLFSQAAAKHGIRADVLEGIARTESNFDPNASASVNGKVTGKGIMQLNPQYFPTAGQNTAADIDTAARHLRGLLDSFEGTEQEKYIHALRSYHAGETNYRQGTNLGPVNQAYAGKVLRDTDLNPTQAGGDTNVSIGRIEVHTQATDANGIMQDAAGAARRKFYAAHSDGGMQ